MTMDTTNCKACAGTGEDFNEGDTCHLCAGTGLAAQATQAVSEPVAPIDMVLHCPNCGTQHIDAPEEHEYDDARGHLRMSCDWTNPPHRSHLCHACEHVWRPADVPTNGVAAVKTAGKADSPIVQPAASQEGDGKPQSLGRAVADALRPYLGEGERVIWQEPFRWHDDSGLLPNHYEMFGLPSLAADFGYEVIHDCGCAGVIRDAARDGGAK